jgi:hypothetical protein
MLMNRRLQLLGIESFGIIALVFCGLGCRAGISYNYLFGGRFLTNYISCTAIYITAGERSYVPHGQYAQPGIYINLYRLNLLYTPCTGMWLLIQWIWDLQPNNILSQTKVPSLGVFAYLNILTEDALAFSVVSK